MLDNYAFIVSAAQGGMTALVSNYNKTTVKMAPVGLKAYNWTEAPFQSGTPLNITSKAFFISAIVLNDFTADVNVAILARFSDIYKVIIFACKLEEFC